jgi:leucyl aminopeptidase
MPLRRVASASSPRRLDVQVREDGLASATAPAVAVAVSGRGLGAGGAHAESLVPGLAALVSREELEGAAGEVTRLPVPTGAVRAVYLVGVGDGTPGALRRAGAALTRRAKDEEAVATTLGAELDDDALAALVEGAVCASYKYRVEGAAPKGPALQRLDLVGTDREDVVRRASVVAGATLRARDLTNTPSLEKSPQWLADRAAELAPAVKVRIRDERDLAEEGFGGILAVGQGSTRPPRLLEMSYGPRGAQRHVVLIGKGITFDSGGLSLKPNDAMVSMKTDMAGGAAVIAAMGALADLGVRVRVTGLVAAAENLPSGTAQRPGDVIRHYGGRTSEVLNTDAEGRLVLADALAYAVRRLRPDAVVDLATLTGAAALGLGKRHAALYATDEALTASLQHAAQVAGERVWPMPLVEDYRFALRSRVADLAHIATVKNISGGSIVAALFLREFTDGRPWAHLDIAGPARADADDDDVTKGATGFGARLLLRWLEGTSQACSA